MFRFYQRLYAGHGQDKIRESLLRMKAKVMVDAYMETFTTLAERYGVTVVGGSLFLPGPGLEKGSWVRPGRPAKYFSRVSGRDGQPYLDIVRKVFLTYDEMAFLAPGAVETLPSFATPAGQLGVLICADSWFPQAYAELADDQPAIIAVPNNFISDEGWDEIWHGYEGQTPVDVDPGDVGRLTAGEARLKYTLDGAYAAGRRRYGHACLLPRRYLGYDQPRPHDHLHGGRRDRGCATSTWRDC